MPKQDYFKKLSRKEMTFLQVLQELTKSDVSEEGFPQRSTRLMRLGLVAVVCARSSTSTGQLSYELFHNRADSARLYQVMINRPKQSLQTRRTVGFRR